MFDKNKGLTKKKEKTLNSLLNSHGSRFGDCSLTMMEWSYLYRNQDQEYTPNLKTLT